MLPALCFLSFSQPFAICDFFFSEEFPRGEEQFHLQVGSRFVRFIILFFENVLPVMFRGSNNKCCDDLNSAGRRASGAVAEHVFKGAAEAHHVTPPLMVMVILVSAPRNSRL